MNQVIPAGYRSPDEDRAIDAEIADSFPASDPPSWTSVIAETRPRATPHPEPLSVIEPADRTSLFQPVISLAGLILIAWAVPLAVVALPVALVWRAALALTKWRAV